MDSLPPDPGFAPPAAAASAAIQAPPAHWQVLHCGLARGVLYLTYSDNGRAGITPAFATPAVQRACAVAGYPVAVTAAASGASAGAGRQVAVPISAARPAVNSQPPAPASLRSPPSFTPQALGSSLVIDARNDGDVAWRCSIGFSYAADDQPAGARSSSTQVTLAPRQVNRVVSLGGLGSSTLRFVGVPSYACNPID